jgi:hypothetical protein
MNKKLFFTEHNYTIKNCLVCNKHLTITPLYDCQGVHTAAGTYNDPREVNEAAQRCKNIAHFIYIIGKYENFACSEKCALFAIFQVL